MTLNIANPTVQDWTFQYRLGAPGSPQMQNLHFFSVPRGGQVDLQLGPVETAQMIGYLETHGARDAAEVHGRMGKFSGLLYRDMGRIETIEIEQGHESDVQTREDRTVSEVVRGALGFDNAARRSSNARPGARITETEVHQELPRGTRRKGGEVDFSMTVDPDGRSDVKLPV